MHQCAMQPDTLGEANCYSPCLEPSGAASAEMHPHRFLVSLQQDEVHPMLPAPPMDPERWDEATTTKNHRRYQPSRASGQPNRECVRCHSPQIGLHKSRFQCPALIRG